ncbi:MAG TPA: cytochrome c [Myxococcota bacterium]|nr:cytochrome c [Myxococcota bacterium]
MRTRGRGAALGLALAAGGTLAALFAASCGEGKKDDTTGVERGRRVYLANCTACHNTDPALPGAIGPAVAGSQRELIEARVLRAEYPPGYTPKRPSHAMVALPHLAGSIDDLAAYLASVSPR